ncbi:chitin deacetylase [Boothiomyces macroporosus]|uniref:Chitin deacetylase n=1 Tax=Boothiomyces macroporosus TaxID=261099 RepID=A0AAD5Y2Z6_9FUNG|nr:chitin deacetylase [Boothiomyces macroporosus]
MLAQFCLILAVKSTITYPAFGKLAPEIPSFVSAYDLSQVPNYAQTHPTNNGGLPDCPSSDSTCRFSCSGCTRTTDIVGCSSYKSWAFTFEDGLLLLIIGPTYATTTLLSTLSSNNIKGTFFVTGSYAYTNQDILKNAYNAGHQIGIKGWSGLSMTSLSTAAVVSEIEYSLQIVYQVLGVRPKYFRPNLGDLDDRVRAILKAMGLTPVLYNYDTMDYKLLIARTTFPSGNINTGMQSFVNTRTSGTLGGISVHTDLDLITVNLVPSLINIVVGANLSPVTVAQCIGDSNPYTSGSVIVPSAPNPPPTGIYQAVASKTNSWAAAAASSVAAAAAATSSSIAAAAAAKSSSMAAAAATSSSIAAAAAMSSSMAAAAMSSSIAAAAMSSSMAAAAAAQSSANAAITTQSTAAASGTSSPSVAFSPANNDGQYSTTSQPLPSASFSTKYSSESFEGGALWAIILSLFGALLQFF